MTAPAPRLLLVDDLALVRNALARALRTAGFSVQLADDLESALTELEREHFDIVMTDEDLGAGQLGIELLRRIERTYPWARRVLLSGFTPAHLTTSLAEGTVERFFEKPVSLQDLRELRAWFVGLEDAPAPSRRAGGSSKLDDVLKGVRVLAIDDHLDSLEVSRMILGAAGALTIAASSAEEALRILEVEEFDALVCDIEMPHMDGLEFMRRVRAREETRTLPALALSAHGARHQVQNALDAGFDEFGQKPIGMDLVEAVSRVLSRRAES